MNDEGICQWSTFSFEYIDYSLDIGGVSAKTVDGSQWETPIVVPSSATEQHG